MAFARVPFIEGMSSSRLFITGVIYLESVVIQLKKQGQRAFVIHHSHDIFVKRIAWSNGKFFVQRPVAVMYAAPKKVHFVRIEL
jgi:hypothetical protein